MPQEYVVVTGLSAIRATVGDNLRVSESTGGMLTGLTLRQVRDIVNKHKWTMDKVEVSEEPEAEEPS